MVNAQHAGFRGHEFNPILKQVFFFYFTFNLFVFDFIKNYS